MINTVLINYTFSLYFINLTIFKKYIIIVKIIKCFFTIFKNYFQINKELRKEAYKKLWIFAINLVIINNHGEKFQNKLQKIVDNPKKTPQQIFSKL